MKSDYKYFKDLINKHDPLLDHMLNIFETVHREIPTKFDSSIRNWIETTGLLTTLDMLYYNYLVYLTDTIFVQFMKPVLNYIQYETHLDTSTIKKQLLDMLYDTLDNLNHSRYTQLRHTAHLLRNPDIHQSFKDDIDG